MTNLPSGCAADISHIPLSVDGRATYPLDDVGCPDVAARAPRADGGQCILPGDRPGDKVGRGRDGDVQPAGVGRERVPRPVSALHERRVGEVARNDRPGDAALQKRGTRGEWEEEQKGC